MIANLPVECNWNSKISHIRTKFVFFWKETWFFYKIGKSDKLPVECESNVIISWKRFFHFNREVFCKNRTIFKFGKIWWKSIFGKKKHFHPLRRHLLQNWWAKNMPVVAGRPVLIILLYESSLRMIWSGCNKLISTTNSISWAKVTV